MIKQQCRENNIPFSILGKTILILISIVQTKGGDGLRLGTHAFMVTMESDGWWCVDLVLLDAEGSAGLACIRISFSVVYRCKVDTECNIY